MKFYLSIDPASGRKVLSPTQALAKDINKDFTQFDLPDDKAGLMDFAQDALDKIHELEGAINSMWHDQSIAPVTIPDVPPTPVKEPTGAKADLEFRQELDSKWNDLPYGYRSDLVCLFLDDVRHLLKPPAPSVVPQGTDPEGENP